MAKKKQVIKDALKALKVLARELPTEKGRNLTGIIGELSACQILEMNWEPSAGYDAIDKDGNKVQIKTRRDGEGGEINPVGTVGGFTNYNFEYALYIELNKLFEVDTIYRMDVNKLMFLIKRKDNALPVGRFRRCAERVR